MKITVGTLFPKIYKPFLEEGIVGRSIKNKLVDIKTENLLSLAGKERVDSPVVGHGDGMLIKSSVVEKLYDKIEEKNKIKPYTIIFSPHGKKLDQNLLKKIYKKTAENKEKEILLLAGRYEGFDKRLEDEYADEIISIGDYVLMGGDLPAMVFMESFLRLKEGIIGKKGSVENDSFYNHYVDYPSYCNPDDWKNRKIPEVLKSGDHKKILKWREEASLRRTFTDHFDWWRKNVEKKEDKIKIKDYIPNHYVVLLHNDVMMPDNRVSESSVTSIDIHDIARSSRTYGIKKYFVVTRIEAQKKLVDRFLGFWQDGYGNEMNKNRSEAIENVSHKYELEDVVKEIKEREGKDPICIVTSSRREIGHKNMINFFDQNKIWNLKRPVIFIFGTAHGISKDLMDKVDFKLIPIEGIEYFNFLSVRSAAAVVLDRWLGLNSIK